MVKKKAKRPVEKLLDKINAILGTNYKDDLTQESVYITYHRRHYEWDIAFHISTKDGKPGIISRHTMLEINKAKNIKIIDVDREREIIIVKEGE